MSDSPQSVADPGLVDVAWMYVAYAQFVFIAIVIVWYIVVRMRPSKEMPSHDFTNFINSSFHANDLYNKLIRQCHPDRFPGQPDMANMAEELFQEASKNRTNYETLVRLKDQAEEKLRITIN